MQEICVLMFVLMFVGRVSKKGKKERERREENEGKN